MNINDQLIKLFIKEKKINLNLYAVWSHSMRGEVQNKQCEKNDELTNFQNSIYDGTTNQSN